MLFKLYLPNAIGPVYLLQIQIYFSLFNVIESRTLQNSTRIQLKMADVKPKIIVDLRLQTKLSKYLSF